jgi:hypothetical protein
MGLHLSRVLTLPTPGCVLVGQFANAASVTAKYAENAGRVTFEGGNNWKLNVENIKYLTEYAFAESTVLKIPFPRQSD